MPEVKPWMRRAAERVQQQKCNCDDSGTHLHDDEVAQAIAAHAPPVEEMVEALRNLRQWTRDEYHNDPTIDHRADLALALYDAWAKRENE